MLAVLPLLMAACGGSQKNQQFHQAPMNELQTGFIIEGKSADTQKLIEMSSSFRVLSAKHGIYEVKGLTIEQIKSAAPSISVEKNKYYQSLINSKKPVNTKLETFKSFAAGHFAQEAEPLEIPPALQGCNLEAQVTPTVQVGLRSPVLSQSDTMNLGETVLLSGAPSTSPNEGAIEIRWEIMPPATSSLTETFSTNSNLDLTPDGVGLYQIAVVAKDATNACGLEIIAFLVTHNPAIEFATDDEPKPTLDLKLFTHLGKIKAQEAWKISNGNGIKLAVLDSGLHYNHPGIKFNLAFNEAERMGVTGRDEDQNQFEDDVLGWDFANGDNSAFDDEGHGSHVAGLAASHVHGVARGAKILPIKVLNAAGGGDVASIVAGIYYAVDNGAQVINASLQGLNTELETLQKAIAYAHSKNVVFVSASGNEGLDLSQPGTDVFPGEIDSPNVINVGATGIDDLLTSYSNFGKNEVDVAAPGGDGVEPIFSLATINSQQIPFVGSGGTSMAAPIVAGVVALLLEANPNLSTTTIRSILMESGSELAGLENVVGSGRLLDAEQAVSKAINSNSDTLML